MTFGNWLNLIICGIYCLYSLTKEPRESQLRAYQESLWDEVKDYYWASSEAEKGTQSPTQYSGGY